MYVNIKVIVGFVMVLSVGAEVAEGQFQASMMSAPEPAVAHQLGIRGGDLGAAAGAAAGMVLAAEVCGVNLLCGLATTAIPSLIGNRIGTAIDRGNDDIVQFYGGVGVALDKPSSGTIVDPVAEYVVAVDPVAEYVVAVDPVAEPYVVAGLDQRHWFQTVTCGLHCAKWSYALSFVPSITPVGAAVIGFACGVGCSTLAEYANDRNDRMDRGKRQMPLGGGRGPASVPRPKPQVRP